MLNREEFDQIMSASQERRGLDIKIINEYSWWRNGFKELAPNAPNYAKIAELHVNLRGQYGTDSVAFNLYCQDQNSRT